MILLIDNYDSFVYNLARYLERLGHSTRVERNDAIDTAGVRRLAPAAVVLSPGPRTPAEAGNCVEIARDLCGELPLLGVCLGHQAIAVALGGAVVRGLEPVHGRTSRVIHTGGGLFHALPNPLEVCRYHSLVVDEAALPDSLEVTARTAAGVVMALAHRRLPVVGVQFHPESILTEGGYPLLANFLHIAGLPVAEPRPCFDDERRQPIGRRQALPTAPVTF